VRSEYWRGTGTALALPIEVGNEHGAAERRYFLRLGEIPLLGAQDVGEEQDTGFRAAFSVADPHGFERAARPFMDDDLTLMAITNFPFNVGE